MKKYSKILLIFGVVIFLLNFASSAKEVSYDNLISSPQIIIGSYVHVYNTGGMGVLVRGPNACDASIANKPDGTRGTVISSSTYCNGYDRVKVRFEDGLEGWVALFYLQEQFSNSFKFSINDRVYVPSGNVNVRSSPYSSPVLSVLGSQPTNALGTVTSSSFYGVPQGSPGFYYFWFVNFDSGTDGWVAENYIEDYVPPQDCTPGSGPCCSGSGNFLPSTEICQYDVGIVYGCPWGVACGVNVGVQHQDRYCSGSSHLCNGAIVNDGDWSVADYCSSLETCTIGDSTCNYNVMCEAPSECTSGVCCNASTNTFMPSGSLCASWQDLSCESSICGSNVLERSGTQFCSGSSNLCDTPINWESWSVSATCPATQICQEGSPPSCVEDMSCQDGELTNAEKQQLILGMINTYKGPLPPELILGVMTQEGGYGVHFTDGWNYNSWYRQEDSPWAQPSNNDDGIMQVTSASEYDTHKPYTNDEPGYVNAINDGSAYLVANYVTYDSYVQTILHYNSGPNTLYVYMGLDQGDRNYLSTVALHIQGFIPNTYSIQNQQLADNLNQAQNILDEYLYDKGILEGQGFSYYSSYQVQLDEELNALEIPTVTLSCGDTISSSVVLGNDLLNCPQSGLKIDTSALRTTNSSQIVLDCNGHTISSATGSWTGVFVNIVDNVEVKNCDIQGFGGGIRLLDSSNGILHNNNISDIGEAGIDLISTYAGYVNSLTKNNLVYENNITGNNNGVSILNGYENKIDHNTIHENTKGLALSFSGENMIEDNVVTNNQVDGIVINSGTNNTIRNNNLYGNGIGIVFGGSSNNLVDQNSIINSTIGGGYLHPQSNNNTIKNNQMNNNAAGLRIDLSQGNLINENEANNNGNYGLYVDGSSNNKITLNEMKNNHHNGISLIGLANENEINRNNLADNGDYGLSIYGSIGNKIWNNNFAENGYGNAYDNSTAKSSGNLWSYNEEGNIWDDFENNPGYPSSYIINGGSASDNYAELPSCGDLNHDRQADSLDLGIMIDYLFAGGEDPDPKWIADFDQSGFIDAIDLGKMIDYLFAGGEANC